ncbi:MAG: hypothetical protein Q8M19_24520 [Reyranella sp.]|nr:hypothetical protein [Reyranella sp.]
MTYAAAETQAGKIISLALARVGAVYPSIAVAQGSAPTVPRAHYYCGFCRGHMPEGNDLPWCSEDCRESMYDATRRRQGRHDEIAIEFARGAALGIAPKLKAATEGACKKCGKRFRFSRPGRFQRFCSRGCASNAARYTARPCLICSAPFSPKDCRALVCSDLTCRRAAKNKRESARRNRAARQSETTMAEAA